MDGVKRSGIEVLGQIGVTISKLRGIWSNVPQYERYIDEQVEIDAHYSGYLKRQSHDVAAFKKDEAIYIPDDIDYESFSGLSNEIKSKLKLTKPKTLGQALRIDGVTPAAAIILLAFIKKSRYKVSA
jgi:tRNA uridine 5-carboxymethylaminomethyl modification enzyme